MMEELRQGLATKKKITILGFGLEGQSFYKRYRQLFPDRVLVIADQKPVNENTHPFLKGDAHILFNCGPGYLHIPTDSDFVIKTPGIPLWQVKVGGSETQISTNTNLFLEHTKGMIIGVTGTKGKSTTATLIYQLLKAAGKNVYLLGNIGQSALEFLDQDREDVIFVYEMSSYQCETLKKSPHIAVLLPIFQEHLDYHQRFEKYVEAKAKITTYQTSQDVLIYCADNEEVSRIAKTSLAKAYGFGIRQPAQAHLKEDALWFEETKLVETKDIHLIGHHYWLSILAASCIAKEFCIPVEIQKEVYTHFENLPYRLEEIPNTSGIHFYDDALATIPQATIAALQSIPDIQTLILGGKDRGLDESEIAKYLVDHPVDNLILFPETGPQIWQLMQSYAHAQGKEITTRVLITKDMQEAVRFAFTHTNPGKGCLLSPGAPSYNLFKDYKERSAKYRAAILN